MPGTLVHVGAGILCPHVGTSQVAPGNPRVLLSGQPAATVADLYPVIGCVFVLPGGKPQPCVTVQWLTPAARVWIGGVPAVLNTSAGLCKSAEQVPQGPAIVTYTQPRVVGM